MAEEVEKEVEAVEESKEIYEITKSECVSDIAMKMTREELQDNVDSLTEKWLEQDEMLVRFDTVKKQYKVDLISIEKEIADIRSALESKETIKTLLCVVEYHWNENVKKYYDKETEEFLKEEEITDNDRQTKLNLDSHGIPLDGTAVKKQVIEINNTPDFEVEIKLDAYWTKKTFKELKVGHVFRFPFFIIEGERQDIEEDKRSQYVCIKDCPKPDKKTGICLVECYDR